MRHYHKNPRQLTQRQAADLRRWLRELGDLSGIVHDLNSDEIISGNQRSDVFNVNDCEIVHTAEYDEPDAQGTVALGYVIWDGHHYNYRAVRWTPEQCEKAVIIANKAGGSWDWDTLANEFDVSDLLEWGFDSWELGLGDGEQGADDFDAALDFDVLENGIVESPLPDGVPDTVWPSDNEWGIPLLDATRQADAFDMPIETWGAKARTRRMSGTYHFYTEDIRFAGLWRNPNMLVNAQCVNVVEPNYSIYANFPLAVAVYQTYKKRWLARYWQSRGVRVFVDLNVNPEYYDLNMMGVPRGWRAYATRGYSSRLDWTARELQIAQEHAESENVLFMVYGGGKAFKAWCQEHGAVWVAEDMDRANGRYTDAPGSELGEEE